MRPKGRVLVGKGVYSAMQVYSCLNIFGEVVYFFSTNSIGNKIAKTQIFVWSGKVDMGKKIHSSKVAHLAGKKGANFYL